MYNSSFAYKLKSLMSERKISGQSIADKVGVSQKTISRYSTGEIVPGDEMQRKILEAIAELGGHPEDAAAEKRQGNFPGTLSELIKSGIKTLSDDEIYGMEQQEAAYERDIACKVFSLLEKSNQKYVLDNFDVFCQVEAYEAVIFEAFCDISEEERRFIIGELEKTHFDLYETKAAPAACHKLSLYIEMICKCRAAKPLNPEDFNRLPEKVVYTKYVREYADRLDKTRDVDLENLAAYLPELVTFNERDWYLLMLIQLLAMDDSGAYTTYDGKIVGKKVNALINYMERLAGERH